MIVDVFSYKSKRGKTDDYPDFYVRRYYSSYNPIAFKSRGDHKTVNCWGVKLINNKKGDVNKLLKLLQENVDWTTYAMSGVGAFGTLSKVDVYEAISKFVSPLFSISKRINSYQQEKPHFFIRQRRTLTKPVVVETLQPGESISNFYGVTMYSGSMKDVRKVMESIDWENHGHITAASIFKEYCEIIGHSG